MVSEPGDRGTRESNRAIVVVCGGVLEPPPPRLNARVRDLGSSGDRIVTSSQSLSVSSPCVDHPPPTTAAARFYTSLLEMGAASFVFWLVDRSSLAWLGERQPTPTVTLNHRLRVIPRTLHLRFTR